ncbi:MAG TPA: addiction module protein [Candidatus Angelobacter sp.]|nr:addiction module protein [Candidatus Angelobacter sp.]
MTQDAEEQFAEDEWNDEIASRIREIDSGETKTIPWDEVKRQIAAKLKPPNKLSTR